MSVENKNLVKAILEKWRNSSTINDMQIANKYYTVRNTEINKKTRNYKDADGNVITNDSISNVKIPAAFLRMSVDQKVDYAFGKPFQLSINKKDDNISDNIKDKYQKEWNNFINPSNRAEIKDIAKNAINCGIGWCYPSIDENGNFKISSIESDTLYPRWVDKTHSELKEIVRDYFEDVYSNNVFDTVNRVEYWNSKVVEKYTCDGFSLTPDGDDLSHMSLVDYTVHSDIDVENTTDEDLSWGKVPFIALKSSQDEMPLLNLIKEQIDAYDRLQSKSVDSLIDDIDPVLLLKGMSAEIKDLVEARELLKSVLIAAVESDGDAKYLQVNPDISAIQQKLEGLSKDIKNFSCTVNTQDIEFGSNPTGVALKAAYQDLDIYINKLETQFEVFMQNLKYFFDKYLIMQGRFTEEDLQNLDIIVSLDRDMMINETELIENTAKLSGLVSQETLDEYNPATKSHEIEQERRDNEAKKQINNFDFENFDFSNNEG